MYANGFKGESLEESKKQSAFDYFIDFIDHQYMDTLDEKIEWFVESQGEDYPWNKLYTELVSENFHTEAQILLDYLREYGYFYEDEVNWNESLKEDTDREYLYFDKIEWARKKYDELDKNLNPKLRRSGKGFEVSYDKKNVDESLLPDEVYNALDKYGNKTYIVDVYSGEQNPKGYHYEINTEYGIYTKVKEKGFLAHYLLDTMSQDNVDKMEEVAQKLIDKYDCREVSNEEYLDIINGKKNESLKEKIVKKGDKYQVQSKKGRNLGTYDTKKEAEDRLDDVEMFKHMNEEVLDESSVRMDDIELSDTEKLILYWDKGYGNGIYVVEKIYKPSEKEDLWYREWKKLIQQKK